MKNIFIFILTLSFGYGCLEQYDPSPEQRLFKQESDHANRVAPKLMEDGSLPAVESDDEAVADVDPIAQKYQTFCASCHGADGKAESAAAAAMNPKPRNLTDKNWQASVDDAHLTKVLKEGGTAVGLSGTMPAWGAMLNDSEIAGMVKFVRDFGK